MKIYTIFSFKLNWILKILLITKSISIYSQNDEQRSLQSSTTESHKEILVDLFTDLQGELWNSKNKWLEGDDICVWQGVSCVRGTQQVESLYLANNNMDGKLNIIKLLNKLPTLKNLNLESNDFDVIGSIDMDKFVSNVEELILNDLNLDDKVFETLILEAEFPEIRILSLKNCDLDGEIPFFSSVNLPKLEKLDLSDNDYDSFPPVKSVEMPNLNYLAINTNAIEGTIPEYLADYTKLQFLELKENYLQGGLDIITKLPMLETVDVSAQLLHFNCTKGYGLTGTVPAFNTQPKLRRVNIRENCLTGTIPSNLLDGVDLGSFDFFMADNNMLSGVIPASPVLLNLPEPAYFFDNNQFTSIDKKLCEGKEFGCDSILCPVGTYSEIGRQTSTDEPCLQCSENTQFVGLTHCGPVENDDDDYFDDDADDNDNVAPIGNVGEDTASLSEKEILVLLYEATNGTKWTEDENWSQNDDYCTWHGIGCNDQKSVTDIDLTSNNLIGAIPTEIYQLKSLSKLSLGGNEISISFDGIQNAQALLLLDLHETGLSSLQGISNAKSLTNLRVETNKMTGPLPEEIYNIDKLQQLNLQHNLFSGTISKNVGKLKDLKILQIFSNRLTGALPDTMPLCKELKTIHLAGNSLTGTLPQFLEDFEFLTGLYLNRNQFTGNLLSFANNLHLRNLDLSNNQISGTIPVDFLQSVDKVSFGTLSLGSNKISGGIPPVLAGITNLHLENNEITSIDPAVYDEDLEGDIAEFGADAILCPPLRYNSIGRQDSADDPCLDCQFAKYYGSTSCDENAPTVAPVTSPVTIAPTLPPTVESVSTNSPTISQGKDDESSPPPTQEPTSLPVNAATPAASGSDRDILTKLYESCNGENWYRQKGWITKDSICDWEGITCSEGTEYVKGINLASNNLVGKPTSEIFTLAYLESLSLYNNPLGGFDFSQISQAKNLSTLLLDSTGLLYIHGLGDAPNLKKLNLRYNSLKFGIPDLKKLTSLTYLSLSNNMFEGPLPNIFELMPDLETLLLQSNRYSGQLSTFKLPNKVTLFDISDNNLSGPIEPSFLSNFPTDYTNHMELDLSNNMLTGTIPSSFSQFENINLYLKGNFIDGISSDLCVKTSWNDADVGAFGCDAILCPYKHWAPLGRSTKTHICQKCDSAHYFGAAVCEDSLLSHSKISSAGILKIGVMGFVVVINFAIILVNV